MRRPLATAAVLAATLLFADRHANAALMESYDLTSLSIDSAAIVRARKLGERDAGPWTILTDFQVVQSYKGALVPGDRLSEDIGLYSMSPMIGSPDKRTGAASDEMFLFLAPRSSDRSNRSEDAGPERRFDVLSSGLRIIAGGEVYRFVQFNNPGGFDPVPQKHDPSDFLHDPPANEGLGVDAFLVDLRAAMARAEDVTATIAAPPSPARRQHLLDLAGPPDAAGEARWVGESRVGRMIIEAFAHDHDLPAAIDAYSRAQTRVRLFNSRDLWKPLDLVTYARDAAHPTRLRAAALGIMDSAWMSPVDEPGAVAASLPLLEDPLPEIRSAYLELTYPDGQLPASVKAAVAKRWKIETDPNVRIDLFEWVRRFERIGDLSAAGRSMPLFAATHTAHAIDVRWADYNESEPWNLASAELEATPAGDDASAPIILPLTAGDAGAALNQSWSGRGMHTEIPYDARFGSTRWNVSVTCELVAFRPRETRIKKTVLVGAMTMPAAPPPSPASPSTAASATDLRVDAAAIDSGPSGSGVSPPAIAPARTRGCGCSAIGIDPSPRRNEAVAALLSVAIAVSARRRRRR